MEHECFFMKIIYEKMFNAENLNITENIWGKLNV